MKKRLLSIVVALTMVFGLTACGTKEQEQEPETAVEDTAEADADDDSGEEHYKVGLSFAVMDAGMTALSDAIKAGLVEHDPDIEIFLTSADGNNEKQLSDVEDLISKKCDIIYIMAADADAMAPAVDKVHEAGIICGIARQINSDNYDFMYVSAPSELPGELQGEWLVDYIKANPDQEFNVGYVSGTATNSGAVARRDGCYNVLMDAGLENVNWVVEQDCNYITETAQACVEGWLLSHPELNVLICANDDMAIGASNAASAAGRDDILILGIDGQDTGINLISEGLMAMSVRMNVEYVAKGAADAIYGMLDGSAEVTEDKTVYGDTEKIYTKVDSSNVADYQ